MQLNANSTIWRTSCVSRRDTCVAELKHFKIIKIIMELRSLLCKTNEFRNRTVQHRTADSAHLRSASPNAQRLSDSVLFTTERCSIIYDVIDCNSLFFLSDWHLPNTTLHKPLTFVCCTNQNSSNRNRGAPLTDGCGSASTNGLQ